MQNVKPNRTLVGQTSDSEQETSAYHHPGSIKMPLIKAGSQLGDIYNNPSKKHEGSHYSKKQQMQHQMMAHGHAQQNMVKYLQNQTNSPSQTFFKESTKKQHSGQAHKKILPVMNAQQHAKKQ